MGVRRVLGLVVVGKWGKKKCIHLLCLAYPLLKALNSKIQQFINLLSSSPQT